MKYIKASNLDKLDDNAYVYVNRNILNTTIAEYEISIGKLQYEEELKTLLLIWNNVYEIEKRTKRIERFVKMKNKDVKRCFKEYKTFPIGSFGVMQNS